jgi:hypothetical protein
VFTLCSNQEIDMGRPGRKPSVTAKRRQTTRAAQGRAAADAGTPELRAHKIRATRRDDLPIEPLGVLYGHGRIDEAHYRAGLRLESARRACFGVDAAPSRDAYGENLAQGSGGNWLARQAAELRSGGSEADFRREARIEGEYDRLLKALRRCGPVVAAATLGIATRPYAGAWLAACLVEKDRPWTLRHDTRLALIREGLDAIDKLGSRPL